MTGLVVVDPVRAFTDPAAVLGQIHPPDQFAVIDETVDRLALYAASHRGPKVWIRPHYAPGQFSDGDLSHPLGTLCSKPDGPDCEWEPRLRPPPDAVVVTKTAVDACESPAFVTAVDRMADGVDALFITGFWLSACVAATAISSAARFGERLRVVVPLSLAATRLGLYDPLDDHAPEVDVTARLEQLRAAGVLVPDSGTASDEPAAPRTFVD